MVNIKTRKVAMKKLFFLLILFLALASAVFAQGSGPITVTEADGSPVCNNCRKFIFGNGSLTVSGNTVTISGGGGSGTVTSVGGSFTGGLISVAGSPVTTSGTLALTVAGTSGGVPYFSSGSTWASSAVLAANTLMIGGGAGNSPATASGLVYASSGSPTFSVTGQSASQLTTLITGANTSSAALLGIQLGTGGSGGDFIQFRNSSGTPLSVVDANGAAGFGITSSLGARVHSVAGGSGNAGRFDGAALSVNTVLVARQGGSSTGNLFETQSSGGTVQVAILNGGAITQTSASATAFESGPNGSTNPVFRLVNSTASQADGVSITGLAAGNGVTLQALSSGTNAPININAKGSGNVVLSSSIASLSINNSQTQFSGAPVFSGSGWRTASGQSIAFSNGADYARGLIGITGGVRVNQGESSSTGQGNFLITNSSGSVGASGVGVLVMQNGTAPTSRPADEFQFYAADYAAGDSRANILSESNATPVTIGGHSVLTGYQHLSKTADYTVVVADSNAFFDNAGAGAGVTFTLPTPTATPSLKYNFCRVANQTVTIDFGGSVTIRSGANVSTSGGNVTLDAVGSCLTIFSVSSTEWYASAQNGTLTFN